MKKQYLIFIFLLVIFFSTTTYGRTISYEGIRPDDPNGLEGLRNPDRGFRMEIVGGEVQPGAKYYPEGKIMCLPLEVQESLTGEETNDELWVKGIKHYESQGITSSLVYIYITDYHDKPLISDSKIQAIQRTFNHFRENGYKAIPLFLYEATTLPSYGPTKEIILGHIEQLEPVLQQNSDIIAVMRAGFVGAFGEWHHSYNNLEDDHPALMEIANRLLEAVPENRMICLRVPKYKRWVLGQEDLDDYDLLDASSAWSGSPKARLSYANDGFMARNGGTGIMTDGWTWPEPPYYGSTGNPEFDMMTYESAFVFIDGEMFVKDVGGVIDGYDAAKRMRLHHYSTFSYFHGNNELEMYEGNTNPPDYNINRWQQTPVSEQQITADKMPISNGYFQDATGNPVSRTQYEYIRDHLGYRIELQSANIPDTVSLQGNLSININLINRGFATVVNPRPVILTLINEEGRVFEFLTNCNPRQWQPFAPGDENYNKLEHSISYESALPANISPGRYKIGLWMPDASESLRLNPQYAIRTANRDVQWWVNSNDEYGINILGNIEITGSYGENLLPVPDAINMSGQAYNFSALEFDMPLSGIIYVTGDITVKGTSSLGPNYFLAGLYKGINQVAAFGQPWGNTKWGLLFEEQKDSDIEITEAVTTSFALKIDTESTEAKLWINADFSSAEPVIATLTANRTFTDKPDQIRFAGNPNGSSVSVDYTDFRVYHGGASPFTCNNIADLNRDCRVDIADFVIFVSNWLSSGLHPIK